MINNFILYDYAKYVNNFTPSQELNIPEWEDRQTLSILGAGIEEVNGTYELITPDAESKAKIWVKPNTNYLVKYSDESWSWAICNGSSMLYSGGDENQKPWECNWYDATYDGSGGNSPTIKLIN